MTSNATGFEDMIQDFYSSRPENYQNAIFKATESTVPRLEHATTAVEHTTTAVDASTTAETKRQ